MLQKQVVPGLSLLWYVISTDYVGKSALAGKRNTHHYSQLQCPRQTGLINHSDPTKANVV